MHFCRRGIIRKYDLIAFLNFSMPLVAVKVSSRFFVQRASTSLWHFLWDCRSTTYHPLPVLSAHFHHGCYVGEGNNKTGINDATLIELQTLTFHETMKFEKSLS